MNIFLDTSILLKDPFWKGNFYNELLSIVKEQEINLFISSVVLKELERNYSKIIDEENEKLQKANDKIEHYKFQSSTINLIDKAKSIKALNQYYDNLTNQETVTILNYTNSILPEILDRAIWKRKPFTDKKTELKDAIIWLTYSKYAEKHNLNDCVLLTENTNDFCNNDNEKLQKKVFEIHEDLEKDSKRFEIYISPKSLIQSKKETLQNASPRFKNWLEEQDISSEAILSLIDEHYKSFIERKIEKRMDNYDLNEIFNLQSYISGYVNLENYDYSDVENINVDIFKNEAIISGDLIVYCSAIGFKYNKARNDLEDSESYLGENIIRIKASFSYAYNKKGIHRKFDIDNIELD